MKALALLTNFKKEFPKVEWPEGAEYAIYLDPDVRFYGSAFLFPGVVISGTTWIEDGCIIGPNCHIIFSRIGKHCNLGGHIEKSTIGSYSHVHSNCRFIFSKCGTYCDLKGEIENCMLGDHVFTRPGCIMFESTCGNNCEIGAEVRRSHLGNHVKAVHQNSYIGDATIGNSTNFASGSITLNFDGTPKKKKTEIGSGCFIGAGNLLVAPLTIGNNVATAAGLTIRTNIPDNTFVSPDGTYRQNQLINDNKGHWIRDKK